MHSLAPSGGNATPDLSPIEHIWDMMKRELTLSPEPATIIAELRQQVQDAWDSLLQDDITLTLAR